MFLYDRWYAAAQSSAVKKTPIAVCILGEPIVLFRLKNGQIIALEDRCPHRHAPLSRGELKDDTIQCVYHGLRYNQHGMCIHIPTQQQIPEDLKVKKYAAIEKHGLIFLWMQRQAKPQENLFYKFPWEEEEDWEEVFLQFEADFNYHLLIDNLMDLSHLAYLHKSTIGIEAVAEHASQKTTRKEERIKVTREMLNIHQAPTHLDLTGYNGKVDRWQSIEFCPPGYFWVQTGTAIAKTGLQEAKGNDLLIKRNSVHMVIPKTEHSTNYIYKTVHKADRVTKEMLGIFKEQMTNTFLEDLELLNEIAACSTETQSKIDLSADSGAIQAQKILESLINAQTEPKTSYP